MSVELGFWIPIFSRIPDSLSCIPDSKTQDSRFHKEKFPGFRNLHHLTWGEKDKRLFRMKKKTDYWWQIWIRMHHQVFLFDVLHHQVLFNVLDQRLVPAIVIRKKRNMLWMSSCLFGHNGLFWFSTPTFVSIAAVTTSLKYQWTYKGTLKLSN